MESDYVNSCSPSAMMSLFLIPTTTSFTLHICKSTLLKSSRWSRISVCRNWPHWLCKKACPKQSQLIDSMALQTQEAPGTENKWKSAANKCVRIIIHLNLMWCNVIKFSNIILRFLQIGANLRLFIVQLDTVPYCHIFFSERKTFDWIFCAVCTWTTVLCLTPLHIPNNLQNLC